MTDLLLNTRHRDFTHLHELGESRKANVSIDREALVRLLTDHSALVHACRAKGIKVVEPSEPRERSRLR